MGLFPIFFSLGLAKSPGKFFLGYMTPVRGRKKQALALIRLLGKCKSQLPAFNATPGGNLRAHEEKQHPWPFFVRVSFKLNATVGRENSLRTKFVHMGKQYFLLLICFTLLADQSKGFVNI